MLLHLYQLPLVAFMLTVAIKCTRALESDVTAICRVHQYLVDHQYIARHTSRENHYLELKRAFQQGDILYSLISQMHTPNNLNGLNAREAFVAVWSDRSIYAPAAYRHYDLGNILNTAQLSSQQVMAIVYKIVQHIPLDIPNDVLSRRGVEEIDAAISPLHELIYTERTYAYHLLRLKDYLIHLHRVHPVTEQYLAFFTDHISSIIHLADFHHEQSILLDIEQDDSSVLRFFSALLQQKARYSKWTEKLLDTRPVQQTFLTLLATPNPYFATIIDKDTQSFLSYSVMPIQRICKYPLLLKEMEKASGDRRYAVTSNRVIDMVGQINLNRRYFEFHSKVHDWRGIDVSMIGDIRLQAKVDLFVQQVQKKNVLRSGNTDICLSDRTICLYDQVLLIFRESEQSNTFTMCGQIYILTIFNMTILDAYTLSIQWSENNISRATTIRFSEPVASKWYDML